jgi:hypothetical protein
MDVPNDRLPALLASGKFVPAGPMLMLDTKGNPTSVEPQSVADALTSGYKPTDQATVDHIQAMRAAGQHPGVAFAEGVGRGAIPFFPSIEAAAGRPKEGQQLSAEANPLAAGGGQFVGNLGQLAAVGLATGGLGDVAEGALTADAALEAPASAAARAAAAAAPAEAAKPIFSSAAMAKSAAAFGAQGLSNEVGEEDMGDKGFNAEALAAAGVGSAALGAVSEPVFGLAGRALSKTITGAVDAASKGADTLAEVVKKAAIAARPDIPAAIEVGGKEGLQSALDETYENAVAGKPRAAYNMTNDAARSMADDGNEALERGFDMRMDVEKNVLPKVLAETMGQQQFSTAKAGVDKFLAEVIAPAQVQMQAALEAGDLTYKKPIADMARAVIKASDAAEAAETTPELWNAFRAMRQAVDVGQNYGTHIEPGAVKDTINAIEQGVQTPLRQFLVSPEVWGKPGAEAIQMFNDATKASIDAEKAVLERLGGKDYDATVRPDKELKAQRFLQLFRGADKVSQDDARATLQKYFETTAQYADMAKELSKMGKTEVDDESIQALLKVMGERKAKGEAGAMLQQRPEWEQGANQASHTLGQLATTGAVLGIPGAGPLAAAAGAMRLRSGIMATASRPTAALQTLGLVKRIATKYQDSINLGAARFLSGVVKPVATTAIMDKSGTFGAGRTKGSSGGATAYDRRVNEVKTLVSNPTLLTDTLARNTEGLADGAPGHAMALHATAMAKLQTAAAAIPVDPNHSMLPTGREYEPDPEERAQFERVYAVVQHPVKAIYGGLLDGTLTPDMVAAGDRSAPKTMAAIRTALQDEIVAHPDRVYTLAQKLGMTTVLKIPVSPDVAPDQVQFQQAVYAQAAGVPPVNGNPGGSGRTREKGLDNLDLAEQTAIGAGARQFNRIS